MVLSWLMINGNIHLAAGIVNRCFLWLTLCLLPCLPGCVSADGAEQPAGDYLGQDPPGLTARVFAPGFVSTRHGELNAVFARDGREFYFTRRGHVSRRGKHAGSCEVLQKNSTRGSDTNSRMS